MCGLKAAQKYLGGPAGPPTYRFFFVLRASLKPPKKDLKVGGRPYKEFS